LVEICQEGKEAAAATTTKWRAYQAHPNVLDKYLVAVRGP